MKRIQINTGEYTLVDDEDFEYLSQFKWHKNTKGYARTEIFTHNKRKVSWMSRMILKAPPSRQVDHRNGNKLDNQKHNLRLCNNSQNVMNQPKRQRVGSVSIYKGVSRIRGLWMSRITKNKHVYHLGNFPTEIQAAMAYDMWAKTLHGEFANFNFPTALIN